MTLPGNIFLRCLLLAVFVSTAAHAESGSQPKSILPFEAQYAITHDKIPVGSAIMRYTLDQQNNYLIEFQIRPNALASWLGVNTIVESSTGTLVDGILKPGYYQYRLLDSDDVPLRTVDVTFDYSKQRIINSYNNNQWSMPMVEQVQDKLTVRIGTLMQLIQGKHNGLFSVADGGQLKTYYYHRRGREDVKTALGPFDVIELEVKKSSQRSAADNPRSWVAPTLNYLPVRLERPAGGSTLLLEIEQIKLF